MAEDSLREWLRVRIAGLADLPVEAVHDDAPIAALGITSRKMLTLIDELSYHLGRELDPLLPYNHPSIDALCSHLAGSDGADAAAAAAFPTPHPHADTGVDRDAAVVGLACRFPGAADPASYWRNLIAGRDGVGALPEGRPDAEAFIRDCEGASMPMPIRGGFIEGVDLFDNGFFRISPNEARIMDPQQRLLLHLAWEALTDAGLDPAQLSGSRTGVFVGISQADYRLGLANGQEAGALAVTGNALSICANRLSYHYDFRGPSIAIDTACSSSLVAVKMALDSLRRGECDLALVAGANLLLDGRTQATLHRAGMLSADYRCATFDQGANGYVRSEGLGMVVLQPTAAARAQRNRIYAIVKGAAVNQDGRSNGLTAPMPQAQVNVIRAACADADVDPGAIGFVEAHGTGTPLGDPIEMRALAAAYCADRPADEPLCVGAVKSNIGHLEAAAGIAALIKSALALHHAVVPANLHFGQLNPHIDGETLKLRVVDNIMPLDPARSAPLVGISSFGFGGTNCHVILEAAPPLPATAAGVGADRLVPVRVTAPSEEALDRQLHRWEHFVAEPGAPNVADLAYSATIRRSASDWQALFLASSTADLARQIAGRRARGGGKRRLAAPPRQCFVFTGQGEHWKQIREWLPHASPLFLSTLRRCDEHAVAAGLDFSLVEAVAETPEVFDDPARAQPCIVALQIAMLAEALRHGLEPEMAIGHSVGEISAAVACGMLDPEEAMRIAVCRAASVLDAPEGGALAVALSEDQAVARAAELGLTLAIGAVNARDSVVLSGPLDAVAAFDSKVRADGIMSHWVSRRAGFHSPLMDEPSRRLARRLGAVRARGGAGVLLSPTVGGVISGNALDAEYWARNLRGTVQFAAALDARPPAAGAERCIEFSPRSVMSGLIRRATGIDASPLFQSGADPAGRLLEGLAHLAESGVPIQWAPAVPRNARLASLPPPDWNLHAFWKRSEAAGVAPNPTDLLGDKVLSRGAAMTAWSNQVGADAFSTLADHVVGGYAILPAAAQLAMLSDALGSVATAPFVGLREARFLKPILVGGRGVRVQTIVERHESDAAAIELSGGEDAAPLLFATARAAEAANPGKLDLDAIRGRCPGAMAVEDLYHRLDTSAIRHGPTFALVESLKLGMDEALAALKPAPDARINRSGPDFRHLDAAMHPLLALLLARVDGADRIDKAIPAAVERLTLSRDAAAARWAHVVLRDLSQDRAVIDVTLADGTGQVVTALEGVALTLGRATTSVASLARSGVFTYSREWVEDEASVAVVAAAVERPVVVLAAGAIETARAVASRVREYGNCFVMVGRPDECRHPDDLWLGDGWDTAAALQRLDEADHGAISALVDLRYLDHAIAEWNGTAIRDAADAARLSMAAASLAANPPARILFVTPRGSTPDRLTIAAPAAPVWGLARCLPFENPMAVCQCLLVDQNAGAAAVGDAIVQELHGDAEMEVARVGTRRFVRRLKSLPLVGARSGGALDLAGGACLVTGATGGLAPTILDWLVERGARDVVCVGRQPEVGGIAKHFAELRARGIALHYAQADVADAGQVAAALAKLPATTPPIRAVVHAAGHLEDAALLSGGSDAFHRVTRPKIDGIHNLMAALPRDPLRWVLLFSSAAGTIGSPGQGAYAAGNAFLDALADEAGPAGPFICSIGWGPWGEVGMATRGGRLIEELSSGLNFLSGDQGRAAMAAMMEGGIRHGLAVPFDLKSLVQFYPQGPGFQLFRSLFETGEVILRSVGEAAALNHRNNVTAEYVAPRTPIEQLLAGMWQRALGVERVGVDDSFFELGGDSVFGNQIILEIGNKIGIMLKPEQVFDHFTIAGLAVLIEETMAERIEAMSDSEVEEMLAKLRAA